MPVSVTATAVTADKQRALQVVKWSTAVSKLRLGVPATRVYPEFCRDKAKFYLTIALQAAHNSDERADRSNWC